jgi:hypothetical protein
MRLVADSGRSAGPELLPLLFPRLRPADIRDRHRSVRKMRGDLQRAAESLDVAPQIAPSAVDLKFLSVVRRVRFSNFKSKTALES